MKTKRLTEPLTKQLTKQLLTVLLAFGVGDPCLAQEPSRAGTLAHARAAFSKADRNDDRRVNRDETSRVQIAEREFERFDLNSDGLWVGDEFLLHYRWWLLGSGLRASPDLEAEVARVQALYRARQAALARTRLEAQASRLRERRVSPGTAVLPPGPGIGAERLRGRGGENRKPNNLISERLSSVTPRELGASTVSLSELERARRTLLEGLRRAATSQAELERIDAWFSVRIRAWANGLDAPQGPWAEPKGRSDSRAEALLGLRNDVVERLRRAGASREELTRFDAWLRGGAGGSGPAAGTGSEGSGPEITGDLRLDLLARLRLAGAAESEVASFERRLEAVLQEPDAREGLATPPVLAGQEPSDR